MLFLLVLIFVSILGYFLFLFLINKTNGIGIQIGGFETISDSFTKTEKKGAKAERKVNRELRTILKRGEFLLANIVIPWADGANYEIDSLIVSNKGIFCIETKCWRGRILGGNRDSNWMQKFEEKGGRSQMQVNPYKQNERHCQILEELLEFKFPVDNIVIFAGTKNLKCIQSKSVFTVSDFKKCYFALEDNQLSKKQILDVVDRLVPFIANMIA